MHLLSRTENQPVTCHVHGLRGQDSLTCLKNYEYFGGQVHIKKKVHIWLTRAFVVYFNRLWTIKSKKEES